MWPYIIGGIALLLFLGNHAKNSILEQLKFTFGGVSFDIANLRLNLKVNVFNPLPTNLTIDTIQAQIFIKNSKIADIFKTDSFVLAPGANQISLTGSPLIGNIYDSSRQILNSEISFKYTLTSGNLSYSDTTILKS